MNDVYSGILVSKLKIIFKNFKNRYDSQYNHWVYLKVQRTSLKLLIHRGKIKVNITFSFTVEKRMYIILYGY